MDSVHGKEVLLIGYLDGELEPVEAAEVRRHLERCSECQEWLSGARALLQAHHATVRMNLPAPPRPWADLRVRLQDLPEQDSPHKVFADKEPIGFLRAPNTQHAAPRTFWWAAVAAGISIVALGVRLSTGDTVNAAELLAKASAGEHSARARDIQPAKIQVRTRKGVVIRASDKGGGGELAAMFHEANFDWEKPLRAAAFADWRNRLTEKQDQVRILENPRERIGQHYRISTSTPQGELREVSIMIRAADLRAVEERFEFRNSEWVEISELPSGLESPPTVASQRHAELSVDPSPVALVSVTDEIRALEALHRIGADLGEPVEVRRGETSVEVTVLGATARRAKEIREAVGSLPHVVLKFEQPQAVRSQTVNSREASAEASSGPVYSHLLQRMGNADHVDAFTNAALETSETIVARAHALRQLAARFDDRTDLSSPDHEAVRALSADHHRALREAVARLAEVLQPLTGQVDAQGGTRDLDAQALLGSAQRLDTLLSVALASAHPSDNADEVIARLRRALGELQGVAAGLHP